MFYSSRFKTSLSTILNFHWFHEHIKLNNHCAAIPYVLAEVWINRFIKERLCSKAWSIQMFYSKAAEMMLAQTSVTMINCKFVKITQAILFFLKPNFRDTQRLMYKMLNLFVYIIVLNCQFFPKYLRWDIPYKTESCHTLSHKQYFSTHRFLQTHTWVFKWYMAKNMTAF